VLSGVTRSPPIGIHHRKSPLSELSLADAAARWGCWNAYESIDRRKALGVTLTTYLPHPLPLEPFEFEVSFELVENLPHVERLGDRIVVSCVRGGGAGAVADIGRQDYCGANKR
jgi:hypothetical protein